MQQPTLSVREIADRLALSVEDIAPRLLGEKPHLMGNTLRFGKNAKLSVFRRGPRRGKWIDFTSNAHGDMLDLIRHTHQCGPADAIRLAKTLLGITADAPLPPLPAVDTTSEAEENAKKIKVARWMWARSMELHPTRPDQFSSLHRYLHSRSLAMDPMLRGRTVTAQILRDKMHIDTSLFGHQDVDALLFPMTLPDGSLRCLQQVLVLDGQKIPAACMPKRTHGVPSGSAIRFGQGSLVVLCEGPETGLAIHQATGLAVRAATGRNMLAQIELEPEVNRVLVASDSDVPGITAAEETVQALVAKGLRARFVLPPEQTPGPHPDFNDVLHHLGPKAVVETFLKSP